MNVRGARVHRYPLWTFGELAYITVDRDDAARACAALRFHALPVHVRKGYGKTTVSLETSSKNRDVGGYCLRRLMLKMSVSLETSSQNGDVEIAGLIFGSSKMGLSPETSSKKWDVEKAALRPLILKISVSPETSSDNGEVEIAGETFGSSNMSISPETSSKK